LPHTIITAASVRRHTRHKPELPPGPLPPRVTRRDAATLLYRELGFPVSPRTLEAWPVSIVRIGGKATLDTAELLAHARGIIARSPVQRGGRNRT